MESLIALATQNPVIASILMIIGGLRLVVKPIMSFIRVIVEQTDTKADDAALDAVEKSKAYRTVMYVLDWIASIKPGRS